MMNVGKFHCACVFNRAEEFGEAKLLEPCGYHSAQAKTIADAIYLLEVCRGSCDLWFDAWPAWGEGNVAHGVTLTNDTSVADVVDAFLKANPPSNGAYLPRV